MTPPDPAERRAWLAASLVISLAYFPLTSNLYWLSWDIAPVSWRNAIGKYNWGGGAELLFGLSLALTTPRASGLGLGNPIRNPLLVTALVLTPPIIASIVIPLLSERPFSGRGMDTWLLSPIAQELVFTGFLYGQLARFYEPGIPDRRPTVRLIVVTALLFSLSHIWGFASESASATYVSFQLAYTFVGGLVHALLRHLSGSIWYAVLVHMAVNWFAAHG